MPFVLNLDSRLARARGLGVYVLDGDALGRATIARLLHAGPGRKWAPCEASSGVRRLASQSPNASACPGLTWRRPRPGADLFEALNVWQRLDLCGAASPAADVAFLVGTLRGPAPEQLLSTAAELCSGGTKVVAVVDEPHPFLGGASMCGAQRLLAELRRVATAVVVIPTGALVDEAVGEQSLGKLDRWSARAAHQAIDLVATLLEEADTSTGCTDADLDLALSPVTDLHVAVAHGDGPEGAVRATTVALGRLSAQLPKALLGEGDVLIACLECGEQTSLWQAQAAHDALHAWLGTDAVLCGLALQRSQRDASFEMGLLAALGCNGGPP